MACQKHNVLLLKKKKNEKEEEDIHQLLNSTTSLRVKLSVRMSYLPLPLEAQLKYELASPMLHHLLPKVPVAYTRLERRCQHLSSPTGAFALSLQLNQEPDTRQGGGHAGDGGEAQGCW